MEKGQDVDPDSCNVSPGGTSRYGRARRLKVTQDFCDIDHVFMAFQGVSTRRSSSRAKPKQSPSPPKLSEIQLSPTKKEIFDEVVSDSSLAKIEDFKAKITNNFKKKLPRGLQPSMKERKFFKGSHEEEEEEEEKTCDSIVDVSKVLKMITNKSESNATIAAKAQSRSSLKTYTNRRKLGRDGNNWIVESFGLPDEPIIPINGSATVPIPNKKLDLPQKESDVILPEPFADFTHVNGIQTLDSTEIAEVTSSQISIKTNGTLKDARGRNASRKQSLSPKRVTRSDSKLLNKSVPSLQTFKINESPKKAKKKLPIDRHTLEATGIEARGIKEELIRILDENDKLQEPVIEVDSTNNNIPYVEISENANAVISRRSLRSNTNLPGIDSCLLVVEGRKSKSPHKSPTLVLNPAALSIEHTSSEDSVLDESVEIKIEPKIEIPNEEEMKQLTISTTSKDKKKKLKKKWLAALRFDPLDYNVGDLIWGKLSGFPFWPCLVAHDTKFNTHVRIRNNSTPRVNHPYYHVIFFGDNGRRAWIHSLQMIPYVDKNDLEELAQRLGTESSNHPLAIDEACKIRSTHIQKWSEGILEAESLKLEPPEKRFDFFENKMKMKALEASNRAHQRKLERQKALQEAHTQSVGIKRERESPIDDTDEHAHDVKRQKIDSTEPQLTLDIDYSDTYSSDNSSSVPASLESQAAYFKRNNIFRGVTKKRVCQICERHGNVSRCKGPCNGVYHAACAIPKKSTSNVEIISVISKRHNPRMELSTIDLTDLTLSEQIDFRMKEIMKNIDSNLISDAADSSGEEYQLEDYSLPGKTYKVVKHVTADDVDYDCVPTEEIRRLSTSSSGDMKNFLCNWCTNQTSPPCLVCQRDDTISVKQKCSIRQCGRYYHPHCLKNWPQTQWSLTQSSKNKPSESFVCPRHVCHTCISDDPRASNSRCASNKVIKCLKCPATYHSINYCVPAGSNILSTSQMICTRHYENSASKKRNASQTVNANWCFICLKGGHLICCETCPTSVHKECLPGDLNEIDDTFYCEDCQSGRLPLYDEIVWVKLGCFRWWPAVILFPNEIPENVRNMEHNMGEFVVKFFGTYDHYWVGRGRTFLFQDGDKGHSGPIKKRVETAFARAIEEATAAYKLKKEFKMNKIHAGAKPPHYVRIRVNKAVGNVRVFDGNVSNTTPCDCDPAEPHPCGPDSDCLNRLLMTECNPDVCPAGSRCNNQCFEKREYPPLEPFLTDGRGWGLKALAPLKKGQFIIEYVGELIDEQEYQRRIQRMHEKKEENYYFLTIDTARMLDAGPKGNVARFMNHCCQPNCETQKWTVNGNTRVGLFAACDIPPDTELTFNYNLECIGKEKKICRCNAPNCSGYIGVKAKSIKQETVNQVKVKKRRRGKRRKYSLQRPVTTTLIDVREDPCFVCGKDGNVGPCNNKICLKRFHLDCVGLDSWPDGHKWVCPSHTCNFCPLRTIRCCVMCTNSYCPPHSNGMIRHDKFLGFVCHEHDPNNLIKTEISGKDEEEEVPQLKKRKICGNDNVLVVPMETPVKNIRRRGKLDKQSMSVEEEMPIARRTRFRHTL